MRKTNDTFLEEISIRNPDIEPLEKYVDGKTGILVRCKKCNYDPIIFSKELSHNKNEFAQILVNSRNRIAHIRTRENQRFLNGEESAMYLVKLSLLYRVVLLKLLGIRENLYINLLEEGVCFLNEQDIIKNFLSKL